MTVFVGNTSPRFQPPWTGGFFIPAVSSGFSQKVSREFLVRVGCSCTASRGGGGQGVDRHRRHPGTPGARAPPTWRDRGALDPCPLRTWDARG